MNGIDRARDLIRRYGVGELTYDEFIEQMNRIEVEAIDLTPKERDDPALELGIRAQAAAERIRRL
jgi:hypothetical protein